MVRSLCRKSPRPRVSPRFRGSHVNYSKIGTFERSQPLQICHSNGCKISSFSAHARLALTVLSSSIARSPARIRYCDHGSRRSGSESADVGSHSHRDPITRAMVRLRSEKQGPDRSKDRATSGDEQPHDLGHVRAGVCVRELAWMVDRLRVLRVERLRVHRC